LTSKTGRDLSRSIDDSLEGLLDGTGQPAVSLLLIAKDIDDGDEGADGLQPDLPRCLVKTGLENQGDSAYVLWAVLDNFRDGSKDTHKTHQQAFTAASLGCTKEQAEQFGPFAVLTLNTGYLSNSIANAVLNIGVGLTLKELEEGSTALLLKGPIHLSPQMSLGSLIRRLDLTHHSLTQKNCRNTLDLQGYIRQ
jgi:hypothetical protein